MSLRDNANFKRLTKSLAMILPIMIPLILSFPIIRQFSDNIYLANTNTFDEDMDVRMIFTNFFYRDPLKELLTIFSLPMKMILNQDVEREPINDLEKYGFRNIGFLDKILNNKTKIKGSELRRLQIMDVNWIFVVYKVISQLISQNRIIFFYNLYFLFNYTLLGFLLFLTIFRITKRYLLSLVLEFSILTNNFFMKEYTLIHPNLYTLYWIPLFLYYSFTKFNVKRCAILISSACYFGIQIPALFIITYSLKKFLETIRKRSKIALKTITTFIMYSLIYSLPIMYLMGPHLIFNFIYYFPLNGHGYCLRECGVFYSSIKQIFSPFVEFSFSYPITILFLLLIYFSLKYKDYNNILFYSFIILIPFGNLKWNIPYFLFYSLPLMKAFLVVRRLMILLPFYIVFDFIKYYNKTLKHNQIIYYILVSILIISNILFIIQSPFFYSENYLF